MIADVEYECFLPVFFMFISLLLNIMYDFRPIFEMAVQIIRMI